MPSANPISDMHIFPLSQQAGSLILLREADHLLRRFGQLEVVDLGAGERTEFTMRAEADRFLFPISGAVNVFLLDLRESSPSRNTRAEINLAINQPRGLLIPFGVACSLEAKEATRLILLSTHSESHLEDRSIARDALDQYAGLQ